MLYILMRKFSGYLSRAHSTYYWVRNNGSGIAKRHEHAVLPALLILWSEAYVD